VALESCYNAGEAFTPAFRDQFGLTPDRVRASGTVENLRLMEHAKMDDIPKTTLRAPRMEDGRLLLIAGLGDHYTFENITGIPGLWQRFRDHLGNVPGQVGNVAYGVCYNPDEAGNFDYIAGVEVADFASLPKDLARLRLAEQRYAVFTHDGHVSTTRSTFTAIFDDWLPKSGYRTANAPPFERYDERFDAHTGMGGFEIWIPVKA
jgi:AraC family transcriptional regulator